MTERECEYALADSYVVILQRQLVRRRGIVGGCAKEVRVGLDSSVASTRVFDTGPGLTLQSMVVVTREKD